MIDEDLPTRAEEMFCFAVYTASHAVNRAYTPHLKALGLTYPQYITLTLLWEKDGQRINDLARLMRMETNTVTPLVKRLEALGHVTRTPSKTDRRAVTIHLTPSGRALRKAAPSITRCMIDGTGLSLDELTRLQTLLFKLRDGLQNEG
ncbi:MarR family winged helix-turn-helix transcriptional regulator [Roseovarius sp. 2305UL8-3]|uniref:MarR family winged helix-turn-helix transcriptional regulator n=1 Tax=Roseovarius conchicola TaxID=3121636 RepID=UPI003529B4A4